jgi:hypothetical protein
LPFWLIGMAASGVNLAALSSALGATKGGFGPSGPDEVDLDAAFTTMGRTALRTKYRSEFLTREPIEERIGALPAFQPVRWVVHGRPESGLAVAILLSKAHGSGSWPPIGGMADPQ